MQVKDSLILTVRSWNHVIIYMLIKHIKNTQSKQLELLLSSLFLSIFYKAARAPFKYQCSGLPGGLAQCTASGIGQV